MFFSIIIPAYNVEDYIQTTLQSVYNQSYKDFEIIVVNDGSTDATAAILSEQTDNRLRVIHQQNSGVSVARNRAIAEAKGKYLAFLDSDDVWTSDHLALAHLFFERHSDYIWYCSAFERAETITEEMLNKVHSRKNIFFEARNWVLEIAETMACANVVILKSAISEDKLFPEGVKMCEDTIAFMKIANRHPMIGFLNSRTMWYRKREGSACYNYQRSPERLKLKSLYLSHFKKITMLPQCTEDVHLYVQRASLCAWWERIRSTSMQPWIEEIKQSQSLHGSLLTFWFINCAHISEILCRVAGKLFRFRYNSINATIKCKANSQRIKLTKVVPSMPEKVSVIIPVYNAEKYLHRCVQSILNQSYKNWEAIFVNDGSTDSSLSILQEYAKKDARFRIIDKNNAGPASARNAGLDALQTDYFTFVDADDSISPDFFQKTLKVAIEHDCDLVVTDFNFKGKACGLFFSGLTNINPSQYVKCVFVGPVAKLYRSNIVNNAEHGLRFPEDMLCAEDIVFTISYASRIKNFYAIAEPMYNYHYDSENSLTHRLARIELPLEQYMYCIEAPWRIYRDIVNDPSIKQSHTISQWVHVLYNELWKMFYFNKQRFSSKDAKKKLSAHFWLRHKDFVPHVGLWKRLTAPQRHPHLLNILKFIWCTAKRICKE